MRLLLDTSVLRFANRRSWAGSEWFPALIFWDLWFSLRSLRFKISTLPKSAVLLCASFANHQHGFHTTTASLYSPNTFLIVSEISPTVA